MLAPRRHGMGYARGEARGGLRARRRLVLSAGLCGTNCLEAATSVSCHPGMQRPAGSGRGRCRRLLDAGHRLLSSLLVLSLAFCATSAIDVPELQLGKYTIGYARAPGTTVYSIPVSQCRPQKYILLELLNPQVAPSQIILPAPPPFAPGPLSARPDLPAAAAGPSGGPSQAPAAAQGPAAVGRGLTGRGLGEREPSQQGQEGADRSLWKGYPFQPFESFDDVQPGFGSEQGQLYAYRGSSEEAPTFQRRQLQYNSVPRQSTIGRALADAGSAERGGLPYASHRAAQDQAAVGRRLEDEAYDAGKSQISYSHQGSNQGQVATGVFTQLTNPQGLWMGGAVSGHRHTQEGHPPVGSPTLGGGVQQGVGVGALAPLPLLLLNTEGGPPSADIMGTLEYMYSPNTGPADLPDYQAVQPAQYKWMEVPAARPGVNDTWTVGVFADSVVVGDKPVPFVIRASCPAGPVCPADCGGPLKGTCTEARVCECKSGWGGATCTTPLGNLALANASAQLLQPKQWVYYYFQVPAPSASVLVELRRTSGDPILFMKPQAEGFLPNGLPTGFDFYNYSDVQGYKNSQDYQYILWEGAKAGGVYLGIYNGVADFVDVCNYTMKLYIDPDTSTSNAFNLCPFNCSFPNGDCTATGECVCQDGYGGEFCQGTLYMIQLNVPLIGILSPQHTVYFVLSGAPAANLSVQVEYYGGHLFRMVGTNGTIPSLSSPDVTELPIISTGFYQEAVLHFDPGAVAEGSTVIVGLYNSDRFVSENATIQIRFYQDVEEDVPFVDSPYMVIIISLVGVLVLAAIAITFRRVVARAAANHRALRGDLYGLPTQSVNGAPDLLAAPPRGLSKELVASFPLVPFVSEPGSAPEDAQCAVCLGEYEQGEMLRRLPQCGHVFHVGCIDQWLSTRSTCPMCRGSLALARTPAAAASQTAPAQGAPGAAGAPPSAPTPAASPAQTEPGAAGIPAAAPGPPSSTTSSVPLSLPTSSPPYLPSSLPLSRSPSLADSSSASTTLQGHVAGSEAAGGVPLLAGTRPASLAGTGVVRGGGGEDGDTALLREGSRESVLEMGNMR